MQRVVSKCCSVEEVQSLQKALDEWLAVDLEVGGDEQVSSRSIFDPLFVPCSSPSLPSRLDHTVYDTRALCGTYGFTQNGHSQTRSRQHSRNHTFSSAQFNSGVNSAPGLGLNSASSSGRTTPTAGLLSTLFLTRCWDIQRQCRRGCPTFGRRIERKDFSLSHY